MLPNIAIYPFSKLFNGYINFTKLSTPKSVHLANFWEKVEHDFYAALKNDNTLINGNDPIYFVQNNSLCLITEIGKKVIEKLAHYTIRHIILFNLWSCISKKDKIFNSDGKSKEKWDDVFPVIFKSINACMDVIEKEIYLQWQRVYFV